MTPKEKAEKLARQTAMQCTGSIIDDTRAILTTIPLVEYEECVEALKTGLRIIKTEHSFTYASNIAAMETVLINLDAKLNEKGKP